jgi:hypothetical protein
MKIEQVSFPEPSLCRVEVSEEGTAYEAAVQQLYQKRKRFYPVNGQEATLEQIEEIYGVGTFRLEALNDLLESGFPPLRATLCAERDLIPLTDGAPELLRLDQDGFAAACTFAVAPQIKLGQCTGRTSTGRTEAEALGKLVAELAQEATVEPPEYAVEAQAEDQTEQLRVQLAQQQSSLEAFLQQCGKTEAELQSDLRQQARENLRQKIVLIQIARDNGLRPTTQELDAEIERMITLSPQNAYARQNLSARQHIANRIAQNRAVAFLREGNELRVGAEN